ncbi:hypothetical protein C8A05DRAFT_41885 [Staphylotrichum tortipilum]|uniref:Ketoreductase domain-containing protein n=1 Tax=Staphylotrichum tortipilum TaxID=2831512 RepID=A0AAN6RWJ8_9PEZI|nr:hypothetical protein C8A05DRAFT_41885 [Staphylotrichum longicolle]
MARPLEGKLGIVTGASRGIGAAIAENLASKGCNLVINYTSASSTELATSFAAQLSSTHNIRAVPVQADVGSPTGGADLVSATQSHFPPVAGARFQIDIIVNNAGIARNAPLAGVTVADFEATYRVNVLGPLLVVQAAAPHLPTDRSGRIVNISSVSSSTGFVTQSVYGGTKAAVEAMTRTWARELAEKATVNAINPGPVEGPMYAANPPEFLEGIRGWVMHTPLMRAREGVDSEEETNPHINTPTPSTTNLISKMATSHPPPPTAPPQTTTPKDDQYQDQDPFDTLLTLEDQFYTLGHAQGTADGALAGRVEGRQLGLERGFQKFVEAGQLQGRAIVWANRLRAAGFGSGSNSKSGDGGEAAAKVGKDVRATGWGESSSVAGSETGPGREDGEGVEGDKKLALPPFAYKDTARLEKHIRTLYALVETESLSMENTDEAVEDFDDRLRRAQGRVKVIERMVGEGEKEKTIKGEGTGGGDGHDPGSGRLDV